MNGMLYIHHGCFVRDEILLGVFEIHLIVHVSTWYVGLTIVLDPSKLMDDAPLMFSLIFETRCLQPILLILSAIF